MADQNKVKRKRDRYLPKFLLPSSRRGNSRSPGQLTPDPSISQSDVSATDQENNLLAPPKKATVTAAAKTTTSRGIEPSVAATDIVPSTQDIALGQTRGPSIYLQSSDTSPDDDLQPKNEARSGLPDSSRLLPQRAARLGSISTVRSLVKSNKCLINEPSPLSHILPQGNDISYSLTVSYGDHPLMTIPWQAGQFVWDSPGTYIKMIRYIERTRTTLQQGAEKGHSLYFYYGDFRIIGQDHEYSWKIEALAQLEEISIRSICGFVYRHPNQRFRLEYAISYSSVCTEKFKEATYGQLLRKEVGRLMDKNTNILGQGFIPRKDRDQFTSERFISNIISEHSAVDIETRERYTKTIIAKVATGVFLACVSLETPLEDIMVLIETWGFRDNNLPPIDGNPLKLSPNDDFYRRLVKRIHGFFAATIDGDGKHKNLENHEVMPIMYVLDPDKKNARIKLGDGGGGKVWKVRVESCHHNLPGHKNSCFALKIFEPEDKQAFDREKAMLARLHRQRHNHIARHIMSWQQDDKYFILSPLAAKNLRSYMRETTPPRVTWPCVKWFLRQVCGLVDAVHHIHELQEQHELYRRTELSIALDDASNLFPDINQAALKRVSSNSMNNPVSRWTGYHHDLKPENILVFEQQPDVNPVFKISDFGAGKFTNNKDAKQSQKASKVRGTASYYGPECDNKPGTSRPFDIWALACVLTELLIWLLQDHKLEKFHSEREYAPTPETPADYYWEQHGDDRCLSPVVERYLTELEQLCKDCDPSEPAKAVLEGMPGIILSCFKIEPDERPSAKVLHAELHRLFQLADVAGVEVEIQSPSRPESRRSSQDNSSTEASHTNGAMGLPP